jgi:ATP-dependent Clp protease adaptor protein ClpS
VGDVDFGNSTQTREKVEDQVQEPKMYRVILHNDDYTTMEFVVEVVMTVFHKGVIDATRIMLDVHKRGRGDVGTYTYDIASSKAQHVRSMARARQFPLKCTIEEA